MKTPWGPFERQPNLLIIMTDQQRSLQHFPPGWAEEHLPWLTHLQKTGVTFERGMCSATACSPSRSTLFTSTYPTINGVLRVNDTLSMSRTLWTGGTLTTLGQVLERAGYDMAYKGKWHLDGTFDTFSQMRPADHDRIMIEDDAMEDHYSFPAWTSPDLGTGEAGFGTQSAQPGENSSLNTLGGGLIDNDRRIVKGPLYMPSRQQTAVDFLRDYDPSDEHPFCLIVSMANPHDIWVYPYSTQAAGYEDKAWLGPGYEGFELPRSYSSDLSTKPTAQQDFLDAFQGGSLSSEDALPYVQFYAYLHTLIDSLTGDLIQALRGNRHVGAALEQDTLIVRLADHGEMAMAQGGLRQKENNCYNESIQVPIIFSNPRLPQDEKTDALVGLIDVLPTLAEVAGAELDPKYAIQGRSFAGTLLDAALPTRQRYLFATDDCDLTQYTSIRALVEADYKYAVYYKADYDSVQTPTLNPNGIVADSPSLEFELYDYTTEGGREEIDNLLSDTTDLDSALRGRWQALHDALTRLLDENHTKPDDWPTTVPPDDGSSDQGA